MSHIDELDEFEAELELGLKKEYSAVFGLFRYCVLTQDATYLCNKLDLQYVPQPSYPFFQLKMEDVWVWDKNRPTRIIPRAEVYTSSDVTVEELRGEGDEPSLTAEALAERIGEWLGSAAKLYSVARDAYHGVRAGLAGAAVLTASCRCPVCRRRRRIAPPSGACRRLRSRRRARRHARSPRPRDRGGRRNGRCRSAHACTRRPRARRGCRTSPGHTRSESRAAGPAEAHAGCDRPPRCGRSLRGGDPRFWRRARLSNPSAEIVPRLTRCPPPPSKEQMARRLWLGVGALALGAAMLVAAQLANASRGFRQGGALQLRIVGASAPDDPPPAQ